MKTATHSSHRRQRGECSTSTTSPLPLRGSLARGEQHSPQPQSQTHQPKPQSALAAAGQKGGVLSPNRLLLSTGKSALLSKHRLLLSTAHPMLSKQRLLLSRGRSIFQHSPKPKRFDVGGANKRHHSPHQTTQTKRKGGGGNVPLLCSHALNAPQTRYNARKAGGKA